MKKMKKIAKRLRARARALELQHVPDSPSAFIADVLIEIANQLAPLSKKQRKQAAKDQRKAKLAQAPSEIRPLSKATG